jgi:hypothetical protein
VQAEIPEDTAGQLEHRWAIPLRRKGRRVARRSLRRTTPTIEEPD